MAVSEQAEHKNSTVEDNDLPWVMLCRKGDDEAFGVLVERYQKKMLNVAYRMIGDYEESCDVVQEAFLAAFRAIGKFRGEARFSTWLYGIVVNHTKNRLRQLNKMNSRFSHEEFAAENAGGGAENGCCCQAAAGQRDSVLESLEKKDLEDRVQECIGSLDDGYREILVLRDIQGLSYEEIVVILKIPLGTVRSRLFRARSILKDLLLNRIGDLA
jgi:RNA polymerase sigma-70 factor (ECF subfamily)